MTEEFYVVKTRYGFIGCSDTQADTFVFLETPDDAIWFDTPVDADNFRCDLEYDDAEILPVYAEF